MGGCRTAPRLGGAALGLIVATIGEAAWIGVLGGDVAGGPRGLAIGLALALILEAASIFGRWSTGGRPWLGRVIIVGLLLVPGMMPRLERLSLAASAAAADQAPSRHRPDLMLLSGLPLAWNEGGVAASLAGGGDAGAVFGMLARGFSVRPIATTDISTADHATLDQGKLLLVAQPSIDAAGLVAIDDWVRRGGKALVLADPDLRWPSQLPPDDPRRPPGVEPLIPLLAHWGLEIDPDPQAGATVRHIRRDGVTYRVRPGAPGRWRNGGNACALSMGDMVADCAIGQGRALLVADADLLLDALWVGMGSYGTDRYRRTADNGPLLIALLDGLRGVRHAEPADSVAWIDGRAPVGMAATILLAPGVAVILFGGILWRRRHRATIGLENPTNLSTGSP